MERNDFSTDTKRTGKRLFLSKMTGIFVGAVFLTGICSVAGVFFVFRGIADKLWLDMGMASFVWKAMVYLMYLLIFVSLVKIAIDEKPFSRTLTFCIRTVAALFLLASVLIPRLSGYEPSSFRIFASGDWVLIDGFLLLPGLLLLILSYLIKEGFAMQREIDEIL